MVRLLREWLHLKLICLPYVGWRRPLVLFGVYILSPYRNE